MISWQNKGLRIVALCSISYASRWSLNKYWGGTPVFLGALYARGGFGVTRCMQRCATQHAHPLLALIFRVTLGSSPTLP